MIFSYDFLRSSCDVFPHLDKTTTPTRFEDCGIYLHDVRSIIRLQQDTNVAAVQKEHVRTEVPTLSSIGKIYLSSSKDHPTFSPL